MTTTTDTQVNADESLNELNQAEDNVSFSAMFSKLIAYLVILVSLFTMVKPFGALLRGVTKSNSAIETSVLYSSLSFSVLGLLLACILLQLTHIAERLNKPNA
ncbi:hypothetical protein [Thalassotalea euphylliae]|uniref:Uncharacterized protein n=1 Tax=Thalassotalea euphylliae TaxID=1655234 RepID=A0A3E0U6T1_9GAMM|nr:hypothetical protein [Thalassotalea euphylliae]REL32519.1 hypothetical protein DXX94_18385 [Thalassotalea euphylliae]